MRVWLLGTVLWLGLWAPLYANDVQIRSGMQEGFTRLFLDFPASHPWQFGRTENGMMLTTELEDASFRTELAIEQLTRQRIADLRSGPGNSLVIELACECYGDIVELDGGDLVIDILDGPAPTGWEYERLLAPEEETSASDSSHTNTTATSPPEFAQPAVLQRAPHWQLDTFLERSGLDDLDEPADETLGASENFSASAPNSQLFSRSPALELPGIALPNQSDTGGNDAKDSLLKQLQRAAAQGLIEFQNDVVEMPADETDQTESGQQDAAEQLAIPEPGTRAQVQAETSIDRDVVNQLSNAISSITDPTCRLAEKFDPLMWNPDPTGVFDLAGLRATLNQEFDKPVPDAVVALAYRYLSFGFGAEARALIRNYSDAVEPREASIIFGLAAAMDDRKEKAQSTLAAYLDCPAISFWALLLEPGRANDPEFSIPTALKTFSELPPHLRSQFGPELAKSLIDAGKMKDALSLRNMMARSIAIDQEALAIVSAHFSAEDLGLSASADEFRDIIAGDGTHSALILAEFIEDHLASDLPLDEKTAASADALAVEHRGTELGRRLTKAAIRAFSVSGHPKTTFFRIDDALENGSITLAEAHILQNEAFVDVANSSDDAGFLRIIYSNPLPEVDGLAPEERPNGIEAHILVADRLVDLAMYPAALVLLSVPDVFNQERAQLLLSEIELATGKPESSLSRSSGIQSEAAARLTSRSLAELDRYQEALAMARDLEGDARTMYLAWLASEWEQTLDSEILLQQALSDVFSRPAAQSLLEDGSPDVPTLASGREQIESSRREREVFESLVQSGPSAFN